MLKWSLLIFSGLVTFIVFLGGLLIAVLWFQPQWLVNKSTLQWAQEKFYPKLQVPWEKLQLSLEKEGFGAYSLKLSGTDFCQDLMNYGRACFDELDLHVLVETDYQKIQYIQIERLFARDKLIEITIPEQAPQTEKEQADQPFDFSIVKNQAQMVKNLFQWIRLKEIDLVLDQSFLKMSENKFRIALTFKEELQFEFSPIEGSMDLLASGSVTLKNSDEMLFDFSVQSDFANAKLEGKIPLNFEESFNLNGNLDVTAKQSSTKKFIRSVQSEVALRTFEERVLLNFDDLTVNFAKKPLTTLVAPSCQIVASQDGLQLQCSEIVLAANLKTLDFKKFKNFSKELPSRIQFDLQANAPWNFNDPLFFSVKAEPISHDLFELNFEAESEVFLNESPQSPWRLEDPEISLLLRAKSFQKIVQRLKGTDFSVPAPFHVMEGDLEIEIQNLPKNSPDQIVVPFVARSDLRSKRNSVVGNVKGELLYFFNSKKGRSKLDLKVALDRLHVQLPPFDPLRGIPPLTQDARINEQLKEPEAKPSLPFEMNIDVQTTENAIRLYHPFIVPYAAFGLNAQMTSDSQSFQVTKAPQNFSLNYLKRSVTVQRLKISKQKDQRDFYIDGRLIYTANDYIVYIRFTGPMDKPEVILTSSPPLDRSDIISVLLYNQPSSSITTFERENVGGTEAALSDRAVGLFGIWAFASTPIETVSYNSVTKTYSAQIKLPEGFQFSIGTNWESVQNLELRRRLTRHWILSTTYKPQTDEDQGKGEIMLQRRISY